MPAREQKGVPFEVYVKGRDRAARGAYRLIRWWGRYNRENLSAAVRAGVIDAVLYGRRVDAVIDKARQTAAEMDCVNYRGPSLAEMLRRYPVKEWKN